MAKVLLIKELYDPEKKGYGTPVVDLVLVHGLDGDSVETWTYTTSGAGPPLRIVWPETLLPKILPRVRVLSFGYNGDMYRNNSVAGIRGNAGALLSQLRSLRRNADPNRPIVFVAHCLGGLIVKQALCFANVEKQHALIASATRTIMFFGTPHCGAAAKQWERIARRYSRLPGGNGQASLLLKAMISDSEDLAEISEDFCEVAPKYKIVTFYETEVWPGTNHPIVDDTSARMMVDGEEEEAVGADHVGICRFADEKDMTFRNVYQRIEDVAAAYVKGRRSNAKASGPRWEISVEELNEDEDEDEDMSGLGESQVYPALMAIEDTPRPMKAIEAGRPKHAEEVPWRRQTREDEPQRDIPQPVCVPAANKLATEVEGGNKGGREQGNWSIRQLLGGRWRW